MLDSLTHQELVTLVRGTEPLGSEHCDELEKMGLMRFSGNQWNEDWAWDAAALKRLSDAALRDLYQRIVKLNAARRAEYAWFLGE